MKRSLRLVMLTLSLGICSTAFTQVDPHFTQYYVYPSWLNPALTGAFDGNYRVSGIYRSQWGNISQPFQTMGLSAEFTTSKNLNLGLSAMNQLAGDGGYVYTTAYGSLAYTGVKFGAGDHHRVTFGLQAGIMQRRFDRSKLSFGDQWNPITGYNPGAPSAEALSRNNSTVFDIGAGALYFDAQPGTKANFYAGFSASHLTKPEDKFSATGDEDFPMRYTLHGGLRIAVNETFSLTPNVLYLSQGSAREKMLGVYGQYRVTGNTDLMFGANYRIEDAVSPFLGFTHKNFMMGLSYDVNISDLGKMANGSNGFEITLSLIGRKSVRTPEVEFVCPRL